MKKSLQAAAVAALVGTTTWAAKAQRTGVSRPEQIPLTTSPEGIAQPVVYEASVTPQAPPQQGQSQAEPVAVPALKTRATPPPAALAAQDSAYVASTPASEHETEAALREEDRALPGRELAADPDAGVVMRVPGPANQLPAGTRLMARLMDALSTKDTKVGQAFRAELTEPVLRDGRVLLPAGSELSGKVSEVHGGRRVSGSASIHLEPTAVTLPDGTRYELKGQVIDTGIYRSTKVDEEGTIVRRDHVKSTVAIFALAAGSGAAAGAVFGGVPGALIGAGVGAGVSTILWLKADRQTELRAGTRVVFALEKALVVGAE